MKVLKLLGEFERRRLYEKELPSAFDYCTRRLGYSEGAAYKRLQASRACRAFPSIATCLEKGELSLAAVVALWPHMTSENHRALIKRAKGKSKRELEAIAASFSSRRRARDVIRAVAAPAELIVEASASPAGAPVSFPTFPAIAPAASPQPILYRVAFDADETVVAKLDKLTAVLRHRFPDGALENVISLALDDSLAVRDPALQRAGPVRPSDPRARRIPRWVRRAVFKRDGGRCTFVNPRGERCNSRSFTQFDHILPWSLGGVSNDPANIRLLCGTHNRSAARAAGLPVPPGLKEKAENTPDTPRGQEAQNGMGPSPAPA